MVESRSSKFFGIGRRRLINILRRHSISLSRTLEQKISDAGPNNLRVNPHILTKSRQSLESEGLIICLNYRGTSWYHLHDTPEHTIKRRLSELSPIHEAICRRDFGLRLGQALEIAVFKALRSQNTLPFLGHFHDLDSHGDDSLYRKEEPPRSISGRSLPGEKNLDFIVGDLSSPGGMEVKNRREWYYPDRVDIKDFLEKCCCLDAVPILIARRIPYVTYSVFHPCGVLLHQTFNQRFPLADRALAEKAKDKNLLGYHDIRLGNEPDDRLIHFIHKICPFSCPRLARSSISSKTSCSISLPARWITRNSLVVLVVDNGGNLRIGAKRNLTNGIIKIGPTFP